ncbi:hypothetical protein KAI04_04740 [Candidatus Pacearchaeota archaeon]|nr:hypothetical protein [Candidatus Pacearchaeota archaeon]
MSFIKKYNLNYLIRKDERFLLKKGFKKAKVEDLELCLCQSNSCSENTQKIHIPLYGKKRDITNLIAIVADDFPETSIRYLNNKEKLSNLVS